MDAQKVSRGPADAIPGDSRRTEREGRGAMSTAGPKPESQPQNLIIETRCPECGAPVEAELWDYSGYCQFCSSLLVFGGNLENELFVVTTMRSAGDDLIEVLLAAEVGAYRARLEASARDPENFNLHEMPVWIESRVEAFAQSLREDLELQYRVDFFAPYRIVEKTVIQGVLGRRKNGPKESFIQSFFTEELERLYDRGAYHLRDRGLKIHGFRLARLGEPHLKIARERFLPVVDASAPGDEAPNPQTGRFDRARMRIRAGTQIIAKIGRSWRQQDLTVYKHLTYACVSRAGREEHFIFDRQFGSIAARLDAGEAETYLRLEGQDLSRVIPKPDVRAVASECPNCGWELELPRREMIAFCRTCRHAIALTAKKLELLRYEIGELPTPGSDESILCYPFWSFRFRLRAGEHEYVRIWDWLEAVSPQPRATRVREQDPAESRFLIPARDLHGAEPLDNAFTALTGWVNWRQPRTVRQRPAPNVPLRMLGVEVTPAEAGELAPFALLALHDNSSTRRLNGANFKRMIADAELELGEPSLVSIPLVLTRDVWRPTDAPGVPVAVLEASAPLGRVRKSFSLV
jgi:hypothetical protein